MTLQVLGLLILLTSPQRKDVHVILCSSLELRASCWTCATAMLGSDVPRVVISQW